MKHWRGTIHCFCLFGSSYTVSHQTGYDYYELRIGRNINNGNTTGGTSDTVATCACA